MDRGRVERQEPGGPEVLEGLLLQPVLLTLARHLSREFSMGLMPDLIKLEFLVAGTIRYLEAVYGCSPRRPHAPSQAYLGTYDASYLSAG